MSTEPTPTLSNLPFSPSPQDPTDFIHIINNLLTSSECASIISAHTDLIPSNVTPGTVRTRQQFDDEELSTLLWERIKGFYAGDMGKVVDEDGCVWRVSGLNGMMRLCLYEKGRFSVLFPKFKA